MSRGSRPPVVSTSVPVHDNSGKYLCRVTTEEAASLLKSGHHGKRNRHHQLVKIVCKIPDPEPSGSRETATTITKRENNINAGVIEARIGTLRRVRAKIDLYNPALSEVRVDAGLITREQLRKMQDAVLPSLKRVLARGI